MRHLIYVMVTLCVMATLIVLILPAQETTATTSSTAEKEAQPDPALVRLRAKLNPESSNWSAEHVYERCAEHLSTVNQYDRPRIRYFDISGVPKQFLPIATAALFFGTNSAARTTITYIPKSVPNTDNRIYWVDLAWFNWSPETWEKICDEDPYFREPIIPSSSKALTYLKGETNANPVMRWDWLCFYAYDNTEFLKLGEVFNENAFYYQLIYSNVEFVREVKEKVTEYKVTYKQVYDPAYGYYQKEFKEPYVVEKKVKKKVKGVGPANAKEFQSAWKVDFSVLQDFPIDLGTMVAQGKSGVSYENRIMWRIRTAIGKYWRTFDVKKSVGDQDFVETPFPKKFDAGEHIVQDNRGCQFYHLTNGADASVDFGDPQIVKDHVSGARVLLTSSSCIHCHDSGIINFKNEHVRLRDIGVKLKAIDPNRYERFSQFYLQEKQMNKAVADDQRDYTDFVKDCNGLTAAENSAQFGKFRAWYLKPVNLEQAARELGCEKQELADAIGYQGTKGRLGALALDDTPIPRYTWERSLYQEAGLLLIEWRKYKKIIEEAEYKQSRMEFKNALPYFASFVLCNCSARINIAVCNSYQSTKLQLLQLQSPAISVLRTTTLL